MNVATAFIEPQQPVQFLGRSAAMRTIEEQADLAASSDAKVLITGETGVGKELVARLIHDRSRRAQEALVTVNCAGLPDTLLESELFGHARGAFTGAYRDKKGLLEMAPNGTLFLDEVGEMSSRMQMVLLRFLETGEIQRVGSTRSGARVNVRLVAATNRDLHAQVVAGAFRQDLFYRLNVVRLAIPPLRDRTDDIPLLLGFFLRRYGHEHKTRPLEVSSDAMAALVAYRWPGNVRELKNVVERTVLKARGPVVGLDDLPAEVTQRGARRGAGPTGSAAPQPASHARSRAHELTAIMVDQGHSFWSAVYPDFMSRDLTRGELRAVIQAGLERVRGNYRELCSLFNMPPEDYRRFLNFLKKHDCHLPFHRFRVAAS